MKTGRVKKLVFDDDNWIIDSYVNPNGDTVIRVSYFENNHWVDDIELTADMFLNNAIDEFKTWYYLNQEIDEECKNEDGLTEQQVEMLDLCLCASPECPRFHECARGGRHVGIHTYSMLAAECNNETGYPDFIHRLGC